MKLFMGVDIDDKKTDGSPNGKEFCVSAPAPELTQSFESTKSSLVKTVNPARSPRSSRAGHRLRSLAFLLIAIGLFKVLSGKDGVIISDTYFYIPGSWILFLAGGAGTIFLLLLTIPFKNSARTLQSKRNDPILSGLNDLSESIFSGLGVPADAVDADILSFHYRVMGGNPIARSPYVNQAFKLYKEEENLILANQNGKYVFPLSELRAIRSAPLRIQLSDWNKEDEPLGKPYKRYKLRVDSYGGISCKAYYILELEHQYERWGICFPNYELPTFEALTGLKA